MSVLTWEREGTYTDTAMKYSPGRFSGVWMAVLLLVGVAPVDVAGQDLVWQFADGPYAR